MGGAAKRHVSADRTPLILARALGRARGAPAAGPSASDLVSGLWKLVSGSLPSASFRAVNASTTSPAATSASAAAADTVVVKLCACGALLSLLLLARSARRFTKMSANEISGQTFAGRQGAKVTLRMWGLSGVKQSNAKLSRHRPLNYELRRGSTSHDAVIYVCSEIGSYELQRSYSNAAQSYNEMTTVSKRITTK